MIKKILIITYEFPPIIGGAGVYAYDLAVGLKKNGHEVSVLTYRHKNGFDEVLHTLSKHGIKVHYIFNMMFFHFFLFFLALKKCVARHHFDLVIFNDGRAKRIGALFQKSLQNIIPNSVSVLHGSEQRAMFDSPSRLQKLAGIKKKLIIFFQQQRKVIVVSRHEYEKWENATIKNKLALINHGIDTAVFHPRNKDEMNALKTKYGFEKDTNIIFSASRLVKAKGQEILIACMPAILKEKPNVCLLIAGNGKYEINLKEKAKQLAVEKQVHFTGGVSREILSELYAICDLFILTSQFESFGLVYLEAAACGQLSIAGNRGGTSDAVIDGETGYLVNPDDKNEITQKVLAILSDELLKEKFRAAAYARLIKDFTNTKMAEKLVACLDGITVENTQSG